ncbi:MAG: thioredoxin family protein [Candidatus Marinimicrobia bacterium]|nr:thioredoxin family protein [Candidatus Neomarinimicrobiota bacterium]
MKLYKCFKVLFFLYSMSLIQAAELEIGSQMPNTDYLLNDISGNQITLNSIKGKNGTLIIFSCNTCPWVIRWEDRYVEIASSYSKRGIGMIAINSNVARFNGDDSLNKMKRHAKEKKYNFPYVQDPKAKLAYAFGATKTPHVYLFDNKDILIYRGAIDDNARNKSKVDEAFLKNALDQMLAGEEITKSTSKALGCSIKF